MRRLCYGLISILALSTAPLAYSQTAPRASDAVNWKLFFDQLFALELRKEIPNEQAFKAALKRHTAYTPNTFNQTVDNVMLADTSEDAYKRRLAIYEQESNYQLISKLDFSKSVPESLRAIPQVQAYLKGIDANKGRAIAANENFFKSNEAANFMNGITFTKGEKQEVALIMVPGFGAHTIKYDIFPEIIEDANTHWGRPTSRPFTDVTPNETTFEKPGDFYSRGGQAHKAFDILHPSGMEMGNTVGPDDRSADLMADWIKNLPAEYANKKLVLLGYSKGAGVVFQMLQRHPELKPRVMGVITFAGVVQGTHIARFGRNLAQDLLGDTSSADMLNKLRLRGLDDTNQALAPFLSSLDDAFLRLPPIAQIFKINGIDLSSMQTSIDRTLGTREATEIVEGISSLAPDTRTKWNLKYLDNDLVAPKTFFFNLTALTDIGAWASRPANGNVQQRPTSLLTPALSDDNTIKWKDFSLDAWFLYLTSYKGYRLAPGGLYDSQVELQHTKLPTIDSSPLTTTLTADEIQKIWNDGDLRYKLNSNGISTLDALKATPRNNLIRYENRSNICAYDLGEFKGHHWSLFHQIYRAPEQVSGEHADWDFPRKAFMRAVLQTLALYNLVAQSSTN